VKCHRVPFDVQDSTRNNKPLLALRTLGQSRTAKSHMHSQIKSIHVSYSVSDRGQRSEIKILEVKSNPNME
jgi:hypothetical protein